MTTKFKRLMEKPVTRRQFIGHVGLLLVALMGFNSVINLLVDDKKSSDRPTHGFGAGKFGV